MKSELPGMSVFVLKNHHGDLHGVATGERQVAEDEQLSLVGQRLSDGEIPEFRADVLHRSTLRQTHTHTHLSDPQASDCLSFALQIYKVLRHISTVFQVNDVLHQLYIVFDVNIVPSRMQYLTI